MNSTLYWHKTTYFSVSKYVYKGPVKVLFLLAGPSFMVRNIALLQYFFIATFHSFSGLTILLAFNYMFPFWFRIFIVSFYFQSSQKTKSSFAVSSGVIMTCIIKNKCTFVMFTVYLFSVFILAIEHWNRKK